MAENEDSTTVEIDRNLHQRIKIFGAKKKISIKDLVYQGMSLYMDEVEKGIEDKESDKI